MKVTFTLEIDGKNEQLTWENKELTGSEKIKDKILTGLDFKTVMLPTYERGFRGREILQQAWTVFELLSNEYRYQDIKAEGNMNYPYGKDDPGDGSFIY